MPPQGEADRRPWTPPHPLASHTHNSRKAPTSYNDVSASLIMRLPSFETFAPEGTSCSACLVRPLALHEAPPPQLPAVRAGVPATTAPVHGLSPFSKGSAFRSDKY